MRSPRASFAAPFAVVIAAGCSKPDLPAPAGPPPPPPVKLQGVVESLNTLCAETWCEGGWQFEFTKLECETAVSCRLSFEATPDGTQAATTATIPLTGFEAVVTATSATPTESFQTVVNDAIAQWETAQ